MKKIMWIVAVLPVVVASMMLQVIPDMIPHKIGIFIFPIVILCVTFFWHLLIGTFEKKTVKASTDKERMEANSSARVLCVVGLSQAIMFGIMNYCILYSSCVQENVNGSKVTVDIARISCILCGIIFVVVGNYMTKAKRNTVVGFRTAWSMYNDKTRKKSNRFGAISIVVAGVLTIITAAFANGITSTILLLVYLLSATIIAILYSKKVYDQEKREV